jgi:TRAP-type transport system periplasmic protein
LRRGRGANIFTELPSDDTDGRVAVQVFPSSQLGGLGDIVWASRSGAVDMASGQVDATRL